MRVYAFDVDGTLDISDGCIGVVVMRRLRKEGHIVGICGNWQKFMAKVKDWKDIINFFQVGLPKHNFLIELKYQLSNIFPVESYIFIGNEDSDEMAAAASKWTFIRV